MIKDVILSIIPVVSSVAATLGLVFGFISKVKSILKSNDRQNKDLLNALNKSYSINNSIILNLNKEVEELRDIVTKQAEENEVAKKTIQELKETKKIVEKSTNEVTALRNEVKAYIKR